MKTINFFQPLEQFELFPYWPWFLIHFFTTNFFLTLIIFNIILVSLLYIITFSKIAPTLFDILVESIYDFLINIFYQNTNQTHIYLFFPLYFSVFIVILCLNFFGLIPFGFTITSHIFITFLIAFIYFTAIFLFCLYTRGINFIQFFLPSGIDNTFLFLFISIIEILSYFIRPFSLSIRLFANMLAGHTLLAIISSSLSYSVTLLLTSISTTLIVLILFGVYVLEFAICCIQAYVFTTLLILYTNDAYNLSH